jgi:hypothetical protein
MIEGKINNKCLLVTVNIKLCIQFGFCFQVHLLLR